MATCSHLGDLARLQPPKLSQSVHREECTQCFDGQDTAGGVEVCLSCFNGGCAGPGHARLHVEKMRHGFTLNVKRKLKPSAKRANDEEPPAKMTKLAIVEDREEDKYEHVTVIKCWACDPENGQEIPTAVQDAKIKALVDGVMQSLSSARQSEVKAWEEEFEACEHTLLLEQLQTGHIPASGLAHCTACTLKENLWLCMTCGSLGCGRSQYGGVGGNGHGVAHYEATGHAVSVKLGTITAEGGADIFCYKCDEARLDPELGAHLATFGINVQGLKKTEKSMTELQIEQNLQYDFSVSNEDGTVEPLFGPGLTGLANLGNSCYIASVLQTLFSLPVFQAQYAPFSTKTNNIRVSIHARECTVPFPAECVRCQMEKVADGLGSGRYSVPAGFGAGAGVLSLAPASTDPGAMVVDSGAGAGTGTATGTGSAFQAGLRPAGFKALVGKGHVEFATMKQQDAEEFFTYLMLVLRRDLKKAGTGGVGMGDPTQIFAHGTEQRLQCRQCNRVRYRVDSVDVVSVNVPSDEKGKNAEGKVQYAEVELRKCVDSLFGAEVLEYECVSCGRGVSALRQTRFASFPEVLVVHAKKFQLVGWVPTKLDIPVILPADDVLEFGEGTLGRGIQPGEEALPEDAPAQSSALPEFNVGAMAQLEGMGFPTVRCQKALLATGNGDAEAAMEWLFAHMEDPDIDDPIQVPAAGSGGVPEPEPEQVGMLADMGFTPAQARKALRETGGNAERAVEWLFNHPDDSGEDSAPAALTPSGDAPSTTTSIGGSKDVPARYRLKAFISHKGPSVHSGHYVAHIRMGDSWVLFNDEKVVRADEESVGELKKLAYLYFFERV
ncbi:ubiquitin carboxyl-terminal hydrolase 14 [Collybia nuda]|uniref:Ubiquitin carboxyl-terminal hydrolase n=1 Tax=Collybia nuda TaxID=64659 RepID=A0A9P5Y1I5_9AGAR|nr:ubiquitin carboxyl-terminal hydrolase 14 [Collybia nuda]